MSVADVVEDLNALGRLAEDDADDARRRALDALRRRLADRDRGAKISEAAEILGVSAPTVRSWVEAGILEEVADGGSPKRVELLGLADVKRLVDMLREQGQNRDLLAAVYRRLRDDAAVASPGLEESLADSRSNKTVPIGDDLREEIAALEREPLPFDEDAVAALCQRFHVRRLSIFGSAITAGFDPETSDVDFLVEFDDDVADRFDAYFGLKEELESLLGRPVDLVTPKSLENPYFAESVERSRRELYAA